MGDIESAGAANRYGGPFDSEKAIIPMNANTGLPENFRHRHLNIGEYGSLPPGVVVYMDVELQAAIVADGLPANR